MRTSYKKYKIRFIFAEPVPFLAENGMKEIAVNCKSLRGAEKQARIHAEIIGKHFSAPTHCEISYKTKEGPKTVKVEF